MVQNLPGNRRLSLSAGALARSTSINRNRSGRAKGYPSGVPITLDNPYRKPSDRSEVDLPDEDQWEPVNEELGMTLENVRESIDVWEEELASRGRVISRRRIALVHALPYVCTLHPTGTSHKTTFQQSVPMYNGPAIVPNSPRESMPASPIGSVPASRTASRSGTPAPSPSITTQLQNAIGAQVRAQNRTVHGREESTGSSATLVNPPVYSNHSTLRKKLSKRRGPTSFFAPDSSSRPSFHPPCPPSRASTPDEDDTDINQYSEPIILDSVNEGQERTRQQSTSPPRWSLHARRGHSALNSGLSTLANEKNHELLVIGRPDDIVDEEGIDILTANVSDAERRDLEHGLGELSPEIGGIKCAPVWVDDDVHADFYELMCKTLLWPIFHYQAFSDTIDANMESKAWEAYKAVNEAYAAKVAACWQEGDLIWIHDYHLLLVPAMLRKLIPSPNLSIALFLHCPFPSSEYFRCLPRREAILDGMLGCNIVIFQTHSYARHFLSSCVRVMGYEAGVGGVDAHGQITRIGICPIGIDADAVEKSRRSPGVEPKIEALRAVYANKKIIVGRDKLDPTKGVVPKLLAFERFLTDYPEWHDKVALIQVTSPSMGEDINATKKGGMSTQVSEIVDRINATFGSLEFQPVHHYHQTVERDEYFALLSVADLALITSTRDGMNTTSMEYVICQTETKGPLIVSEFTGVSASLNKAIKINPWDLSGVARAINQALTMSLPERIQRHAALYDMVTSHTAAVWASTNILKLLDSLQGEQGTHITSPLEPGTVLKGYSEARKRLLMFDYDGTLTPIVKNPADALPSQKLLDSLATLAADPKNIVYIISGRDGSFLDQHLGHIKNLGMSAEHGCFIRPPKASGGWISLTDALDLDWKKDVTRIFRYYEARTPGSFVEQKVSSVTFHYRNADPVFGVFQAKECQAMLESMQESLPIDVLVGKKNVEVRPAHTNKGEIVQRLLYLNHRLDFCMCAGDDKTDEDMFQSMSRTFSSALSETVNPDGTARQKYGISPPDSLRLFPALSDDLPAEAKVEGSDELQVLECGLKPENMWMIAIEKEGQTRMTMANALLHASEDMVDLLAQMAEISKV